MSAVQDRITELGQLLPPVVPPLAAYVPAVRTGNLVFTSGALPLVSGELLAHGLVADQPGDDVVDGWVVDSGLVDVAVAKACAAQCALNAIAAIGTVVDLDKITRVVKVTGFVAGVEGFASHPQVVNGASELLLAIWGDDGKHARSAVGVATLPLGSPVELELVVEVAD
ncbi:MAG: RidA family protein [Actinomycetes bacterium]